MAPLRSLRARGRAFFFLLLVIRASSSSSPTSSSSSHSQMEEAVWHALSLLLLLLGCACGALAIRWHSLICCSSSSAKKMPCSAKFVLPLKPSDAATKVAANITAKAELSMMEQLVPEITHHVLSYLDFKSLCCMSMTNVAMRKAANDESAWKSLYHKDWNPEQQNIVPPHGWKAYYAVTKAVAEANRAFYNKFKAKSLRGMGQIWLHADYVKCIHPGGELISGFDAVMENWRLVFNWSQRYDFELQDVKVRVSGDMAWVTSKAFVNASVEPLLSTNCYERHGQQWYVVHHHCSPQLDFAFPDYGMFS
ncbi:F-box protein SKIP8 isoform X1 [Selaginella moellendorffii]|nr:F-box protein SKIP8 isoform X1 [Selaginella moellendorffii]|eukprot:XP_002988871.2 F-box protein SKIP8 isoform X1 [Selaginella moellendorffii]